MFDFGWQEFMMIAFVLVLVVGPRILPKVLRGFHQSDRPGPSDGENLPVLSKMLRLTAI